MQQARKTGGYIELIIVVVIVFIVLGLGLIYLDRHYYSKTNTPSGTKDLSSYCVGKTFASGASGNCVSDIQTLINYMENSGLTQCPFDGGAPLTVNGTFDSITTAQVKSVQGWASCYATQEGFTTNVIQNGTVDKTTWGELCTYGYTNPSHSGASGATSAIAAGKDAGCAQLQS
jgi:hypothetical protein